LHKDFRRVLGCAVHSYSVCGDMGKKADGLRFLGFFRKEKNIAKLIFIDAKNFNYNERRLKSAISAFVKIGL
jgi:hypothetical protein